MPQLNIEFLGIPQVRIGCREMSLAANTIGDVCRQLAERSPGFANGCLQDGELKPEFLISINGQDFTRDLDRPLQDGDSVIFLNADVGG